MVHLSHLVDRRIVVREASWRSDGHTAKWPKADFRKTRDVYAAATLICCSLRLMKNKFSNLLWNKVPMLIIDYRKGYDTLVTFRTYIRCLYHGRIKGSGVPFPNANNKKNKIQDLLFSDSSSDMCLISNKGDICHFCGGRPFILLSTGISCRFLLYSE
jgi:hypothetical protein